MTHDDPLQDPQHNNPPTVKFLKLAAKFRVFTLDDYRITANEPTSDW